MQRTQQSRQGRGGSRKRIVITDCDVTPIDAHGFGFGVRGLATVTLNNALVLKSLRIITDREGALTVGYPAQMGRDKTWFDVVEPKSETLREEIARRVIAEYERVIKELEAEQKAEAEASQEPAPEEPLPEGPEPEGEGGAPSAEVESVAPDPIEPSSGEPTSKPW